jgi:hypothetical protein
MLQAPFDQRYCHCAGGVPNHGNPVLPQAYCLNPSGPRDQTHPSHACCESFRTDSCCIATS